MSIGRTITVWLRHMLDCSMSVRRSIQFSFVSVFVILATNFAAHSSSADERNVEFRPHATALINARLVVRPGTTMDAATVLMRDGLIEAAGQNVKVPSNAEVIDCSGLIVYPGFIDAAAVDLIDDKQQPKPDEGRTVDFSRHVLAATRADNRKSMTPEFRSIDALKLDEKILDSARSLGFTALHVVPNGRIASGQGVLLAASGFPVRESVLIDSTVSEFQLFAPRGTGYPTTLMGATAHLRQAFLDTTHSQLHRKLYDDGVPNVARPPRDATLRALESVLQQSQRTLFYGNSRDDIFRALRFCLEHNLAPIIWGGHQAARVAETLREQKVDLILEVNFGEKPKIKPYKKGKKLNAEVSPPLRAQRAELNLWREKVTGLNKLQDSNIRFAFSSNKLSKRSDLLPAIRTAIEEGLPSDAALAALTVNAAAILGIDARLGTVEPGRLAHVVVMTKPFHNTDSKVKFVFVDGHKFEYNNEDKDAIASDEISNNDQAITGTWRATIKTANGLVNAELVLVQDKDAISGTFASDQGNGKLSKGTREGDKVEFTVAIGAGERAVTIDFSAQLASDTLTGDLKPPFGSKTTWTAKRQAEQKTEKRLPVVAEKPDIPPIPSINLNPNTLPTEIALDRLRRPPATGGDLLVKNATVLTGTGETLAEASILIRDGKIAEIGADLSEKIGTTVIDATGRFVMPGILDTHSHIMITSGINEYTQSLVPEVRIRDVIRSDDPAEYRALAGGVTTIRILHGSANVVGGQDAVVKLKYNQPAHEQILYDVPQGVKFALGENVKYRRTRFPNTRLGVEATLNRAFLEAVDYRRRWMEFDRSRNDNASHNKSTQRQILPPRRDLRLEALADIVNHKKFIHSHCYRADEILMLLRVASNLGIRVWSLQHVLEGYKVAPEIVAHGASCSTFSDWWAYKVEAYDAIPYNAALLKEAGANVVIKSDNSELLRHMTLEAAKTVRYGGLTPEAALQTVTLNSARELGIDDRVGSIEVGKDGDLAIFTGHPLNAFSKCVTTIIEGEIYFSRDLASSVVLPDAEKLSSNPLALEFVDPELRQHPLDLTEAEDGRYAIVNAILHPVDQPDIESGSILIENGLITAIGKELEIPANTHVINAHGLHVTPGMIDAGTTIGLVEIGRVQETHDFSEGGMFQPDIRAGVALNPDSELIPVARAGGITTVFVRPTGGIIAGQCSLAKLAGWTAPEMILDLEAGLQIIWPTRTNEETKKTAKDQIQELNDFLKQARLYADLEDVDKDEKDRRIADPRFEALRPYVKGEKRIFIEADTYRAIAEALLFADENKLKIAISGGSDAWKLAEEFKQRDVPVIVGPVMRAPVEAYDPYDAPYANLGRLFAAGVRFCVRSNNASNSRNTPFEAAMAVAYGLPASEALRAVTLGSAEILGIDKQVGSLTPGKQADLVISDGSLLQLTTQIKGTFINGRPYAPENRQTRYYERYRRRLHEYNRAAHRDQPGDESQPVGSQEPVDADAS